MQSWNCNKLITTATQAHREQGKAVLSMQFGPFENFLSVYLDQSSSVLVFAFSLDIIASTMLNKDVYVLRYLESERIVIVLADLFLCFDLKDVALRVGHFELGEANLRERHDS